MKLLYVDCSGSVDQHKYQPIIERIIAAHPDAKVFGFADRVWEYTGPRGGNWGDTRVILAHAESLGATEVHVITDYLIGMPSLSNPSMWTWHVLPIPGSSLFEAPSGSTLIVEKFSCE